MVLRDSEQCILHEPQIRALARIKLPYSRGAKRVKMVLKKAGRDAYQLGHPCLLKTNTNKKFLLCALSRGIYHLHFSERSIYHLYILASVAYITSIFQRAQHISLVYFGECSRNHLQHSIYHLYILASIAYITSIFQRAYITSIFQRVQHISLLYFSEHSIYHHFQRAYISLVNSSECSIYHLHI